MSYFNKDNKYSKPTLIKFLEPKKIEFCKLNDFLSSYRPFPCSEVYLYEEFEYGDYDNWVKAIIYSKTIDPKYSRFHEKEEGIFKENETSFSIMTSFWNYSEDKPFWNKCPNISYDINTYKAKYIKDLTITVNGVFVISYGDKQEIENKFRRNYE